MTEQRSARQLATEAAEKVPKIARANLVAMVKAKEEGKKVAYAFIDSGQEEIMRAMDIVPAWVRVFLPGAA